MNITYSQMVDRLMKKGDVMMSEWTNEEKQILKALRKANSKASKFWNKIDKHHFPLGNPADYEMYHVVSALAGEIGELYDAYKKAIVYRKTLDNNNIIEEFGDIEWFKQAIINVYSKNPERFYCLVKNINETMVSVNALAKVCGINLEEAQKKNMEKLMERYKGLEYSDQQAKQRADKNEFITIQLEISDPYVAVDFYPDVPKVCLSGKNEPATIYVKETNSTYDQELLIQICKSKIEKEKGE